MQEVICFHCGNAVKISPDQSLCSECGEDLQHLLAPEFVAGYFYQRAQTLADQGDAVAALAQVERGLTYAASAELHLLAAILAQQVERYDQMRHHVATRRGSGRCRDARVRRRRRPARPPCWMSCWAGLRGTSLLQGGGRCRRCGLRWR
jgi:hypothetical protein